MRGMRLAATAIVVASTLALFQNCGGAAGTGTESADTPTSAASKVESDAASCALQPTTASSLVSLSATASNSLIIEMAALDVAACAAHCDSAGAAYCELFALPPGYASPYRCLAFNQSIDQMPSAERGPLPNPNGGNLLYVSECGRR